MKINIKTEDLLTVLNKIKHIAKEDKNCLVLGSGLFRTLDDEIEITVSSLLNRAIVRVPADILESGECLIEVDKLVGILETLTGDICIEKRDNSVWIKRGRTKCKLLSIDVNEFPVESFEIHEPSIDFSMTAAALFEGLSKAKRFVCKTDGNILCGVKLEIKNSLIKFIATDGNRLAIVFKCINERDLITSFVMPKNSIDNLLAFLEPEDNVELKLNNSTCCIEYTSIKFYTRLLQGEFPKCENLVPKNVPNKYVFNKAELKNVLERIKAVETREDGCIVYFSISENTAKIEAKDAKANDVIDIEKTGENLAFALNRVYLEIVVGVITGENIIFEMSASNKTILFNDMENKYMIVPIVKRGENV